MTKLRAREADRAKTVTNRRFSISSSKLKNLFYIVWLNSQSLPFIYLKYCIQVLLGGIFCFSCQQIQYEAKAPASTLWTLYVSKENDDRRAQKPQTKIWASLLWIPESEITRNDGYKSPSSVMASWLHMSVHSSAFVLEQGWMMSSKPLVH